MLLTRFNPNAATRQRLLAEVGCGGQPDGVAAAVLHAQLDRGDRLSAQGQDHQSCQGLHAAVVYKST